VSAPIVELVSVSKRYRSVHAVDDVSLTLAAGRTVGVVGESGCGKSTTARLILGLERTSGGELRFRGQAYGRSARALRPVRRAVGMIFQDPYESLDPRFTVREIVAEPLRAHGRWRAGGEQRVRKLLADVGLDGAELGSYPGEYSGGQRQRIGIARALALDPELVICDEPTSSLDVSVQAQILNLLNDLQETRQLTLLLITHNLSLIQHMCDRAAVMSHGEIVETGPVARLFSSPQTDETRLLLDAVLEPTG
jgi:ABC-type glutathione transport system ATPase component